MRRFFVVVTAKNPWLCSTFSKKCDEIWGIFMQFYAMKLWELPKIAGTCGKMRDPAKNAAFRWRWRRAITSLHNVLLLWCKRNFFKLSDKIYVIFLQQKCGDYEIMKALHILFENRQFMRWKYSIFERMRPPHEYADIGWLCIELCDRIIPFFWRDWNIIGIHCS